MRGAGFAAGALAASLTMAQPAVAAEDFRDAGASQRRSSAFAGAVLRVPLGTARPSAPTARLQLGFRHQLRDGRGASLRPVPGGASFELGATRLGKPVLSVGGRDLAAARRRLGIKGDTGWVVPALIIGAVVVAAVLLTDPSSDPAPATPATPGT